MSLSFKVNDAKSFFFDSEITKDLDDDARRGLARFGGLIRTTARRSMRKPRQKKLSEMTSKERQEFHIRSSIAKKMGEKKPRRPNMPSAPGEPPRVIGGQVKKFLYFGYDKKERSVVVGPAKINSPTGAPETLEKGGTVNTRAGRVKISKRPYMLPAHQEHISKLPSLITGGS